MKRKMLWISLSFVLLLAGCGSNGLSDNTGSNPAADGAQADKEQPYDFVFVCPTTENEYWEDCMRGISKADEELGTTTQVVGPSSADNFSTEMIGHMEQAVQSSPDGIMAYAGIEDMAPLINQADRQGIPVLAIDSDAPDTSRIAYIGTDLYSFGYMSGETLVMLTGGQATIGYLCSSFSAQNEAEIFNAFQDAIADYDMEVIAMEEGRADPDYAAQVSKTMLEEHPEITAIFCTAGYNITGAARAKKELGLDGLMLLGFDDVTENLSFVREGVIDALLVQSPYQMGYQSVHLLKEYVDEGSLDHDTYDTASILVTQENVDHYKE